MTALTNEPKFASLAEKHMITYDDNRMTQPREEVSPVSINESVAKPKRGRKARLGAPDEQDVKDLACRKEETRRRALYAERLIAARKLNGWDQQEAAAKLGYKNSTQLSLLESRARPINLHHIVAAAQAYKVSTDYLLGREVVETELDARRLVATRLNHGLREIADILMGHIETSKTALGGPTVNHFRTLIRHADAVVGAAGRTDVDAMEAVRGGPVLMYTIEELKTGIMEAEARLAGYDNEVARLREVLRTPAANDPECNTSSTQRLM